MDILVGHRFTDKTLLQQALTHRSHSAEHNERLEFLGDAILDAILADWLYRHYPEQREGGLSRMKSSLVSRVFLAEKGRAWRLGPCLQLGRGELKSGGRERDSILSCAAEAVIGALYLDAGYEVCRDWILLQWHKDLQGLEQGRELRDAKTRLQEWAQSQGHSLPVYQRLGSHGKDHCKRFTIACRVADAEVEATAGSISEAEQRCAAACLQKLHTS